MTSQTSVASNEYPVMCTTTFIHPIHKFSRCLSSRRYVRSWHRVRHTWHCWGPRPAWFTRAHSSLCPLSSPWLLRRCTIACPRGCSISAWPSKSYRYEIRKTRHCTQTQTVSDFLCVNMPTEPGPCHWLVRLSAGCFPPTSPVWRWSRPPTKLTLHRANVPHYPQLVE